MVIDTHTHVCNKKTWETYQKKSKNAVSKVIALPMFDETVKIWPDTKELLNFSQNEPRVFSAGSIDMNGNIRKQVEFYDKLFSQNKICAIKLYPGYQHFYPSDKKVYPVAKLCQKHKKPLIFHSGDLYDIKKPVFLKYSHPIYVDELASLFPNTIIIIAHFGFPHFMETANIVSKNTNVYTDISGTIDGFGENKEELQNIINQYSADLRRVFNYYPNIKNKVMFASDYGGEETELNLVIPYINVIRKILNEEEQKNAFCKLAEKLFFK